MNQRDSDIYLARMWILFNQRFSSVEYGCLEEDDFGDGSGWNLEQAFLNELVDIDSCAEWKSEG